jgi:hypothetical protein
MLKALVTAETKRKSAMKAGLEVSYGVPVPEMEGEA